jgi:collagenase-like PrtC family protease
MMLLSPVKTAAEVPALLKAGADEFYCGLTPPDWEQRFGLAWSNRRASQSAGVTDLTDFERLLKAASGRPVFVALNAPYYPPGGVELLAKFGRQLLKMGATALIIADMELLLTLAEAGYGSRLHVSSLATCNNSGSAEFFRELGVSRIILPRHLTLNEIEQIKVTGLEIEAFLLNDGCIFEEGLCATTHAAGPFCLGDGEGTAGIAPETLERYEFWKWTLNHCGCQTSQGYPMGPCGLCALPRLLQAGIASFKVVGREASLPRKEKSVEVAAMALRIARAGGTAQEIRQAVIDLRGASAMCEESHLCYYPDVWQQE